MAITNQEQYEYALVEVERLSDLSPKSDSAEEEVVGRLKAQLKLDIETYEKARFPEDDTYPGGSWLTEWRSTKVRPK